MKRFLLFFAFFLLAELCMEKASGLDEYIFAPFLSIAEDISTQSDDGIDMLFGIGLNVLLLFNGEEINDDDNPIYRTEIFLMVEPMVSVEYSFSSDLLRIRTGAHIGIFHYNYISFDYYTGLSGMFIKDFANDAVALGIAPEIGFEFIFLFIGFRVQGQYDFYTIERYNRFIITASLTVILPLSYL